MLTQGDSGESGLGFANMLRDCLLAGVIIFDADRKIATLTPEAQHILGSNTRHPLTRPLEGLPSSLAALVHEASVTGQSVPAREITLQLEHRGVIPIRASVIALRPGTTNSGVALVLNDLTIARRFEEHLQKLDRLANAGTLAASMAHEIKNALVAGKTFVDLVLEQNPQSELAEVVRREMGRIESIVGRMLKLAAPGKATFSPVHIHSVLEHSVGLIQPQLESRAIALKQVLDARFDVVNGDENELQQAFVNLLLNAFESMGQGGTLAVRSQLVSAGAGAATRPEQVCVIIQDSGPGILPEHMPHLFEPFFTTKPSGTGLGLAVTRRIVQEHQGHIAAESKPCEGTTFRITLPLLVSAD
jgi:signal transduction histidine kinase